MRALVWRGSGTLELSDQATPKVGPRELLIRTKAVGICGSDFHILRGHFAPARPPLVLGHEAAGEVAEVGQLVNNIHIGERVVINPTLSCNACHFCRRGFHHQCLQREIIGMTKRDGAFADFFTVPASNVFRLPDSVSWEDAATIDPLACSVHALNLCPQSIGESVAIFGAGPSGLCFVQLSRLRGASQVISVDLVEHRLSLAKALGAHHIVNASTDNPSTEIRKITGGLGAHLCVEASGASKAVSECISSTRCKGNVLIYGVYSGLVDGVDFQDQHRREITIYGSSGECYPTAISLIGARQIEVQSLISHRLRLDDLPHFFHERLAPTNDERFQKAIVLVD